jgi:hypothetical protein
MQNCRVVGMMAGVLFLAIACFGQSPVYTFMWRPSAAVSDPERPDPKRDTSHIS